MCDQANRHRSERSFNPDDWVWVRLQPHRQQSVERCTCSKLAPRYSRPYQVRRRIGVVAYELCLPATSRVHPVFHVSLLRAFKGTHVATNINSLSHADRDSPNSLNTPTPNPKSLSIVQPLHSPNFETPSEEQLMPPPNSAPRDSTLSNQHLIAPPNPAEILNPPLSHSPDSLPQPPIPTTHQRPRNDHTTHSQIQDFTPNNSITFQNNPQIGQPNVHPLHPTHHQARSNNYS